jgi:hypothetical protein
MKENSFALDIKIHGQLPSFIGWLKWKTLRITGILDLCPSSAVLETRDYNVSEPGTVSVLR